MALDLRWIKRAQNNFDNIVQYLLDEWDESVAGTFVFKVDQITRLISTYPDIGKVEVKNKKIRGFLISSQTSIFYRVTDKEIIILQIFDNRQNPDKKDF